MNINTGPLTRECYEISLHNEKQPPGEHQTAVAVRLSELGMKIEKLEALLKGDRVRWCWHDREVAIESVEDDCQNADYAYGSVNEVRIAVAVELPDEWYVWHEAGEEGENELFGPFDTEAEAKAKRDELRATLAKTA